jgi:hypothetical protein
VSSKAQNWNVIHCVNSAQPVTTQLAPQLSGKLAPTHLREESPHLDAVTIGFKTNKLMP